MAEQKTPPSFENFLEKDLQRLAAEVKSQRERPEMTNAAEKELLKEAIRSFPELKPANAGASGAAVPASDASGDASGSPLPAYAQSAPPEVKLEIEYLLDTALRQGIGKALSESVKSPYFVQDAFHDALAGRLYPELQRRGIVK